MNIRARGYKIKSYGFPVSASTNQGSLTIKIEIGQAVNGLLTTRVNSVNRTINMEVVGVKDHLIKKWLVIKAKPSAQVLTSPLCDSHGVVLFTIP